jgi:hypothetical protein
MTRRELLKRSMVAALYQRERNREPSAPMVKKTRFAPDKLLQW